MEFETFMAAVDRHLFRMIGCKSADLPDHMYWDAWNEGQVPFDVAVDVLEENGFAY